VIAWPAPDTGPSFARSIAAPHLPGGQTEIPIIVPMRTERFPARDSMTRLQSRSRRISMRGAMWRCFAREIRFSMDRSCMCSSGWCGKYTTEVVPGVSSMMAAASAAGRPLAARNDVLSVVPGPLDDEELTNRFNAADALAIIKIGRHFKRLRALIEKLNLLPHAIYVERVSLGAERLMPLADVPEDTAPYFSMILIYKGGEDWIQTLPGSKP
jgi:precorrin-2/cobalt-factor-2 C20-methyltransferase